MMEPIEKKAINAAIDAHFIKAPFAEKPFEVNAVIPERTFLEKVFLLHEEFKKNEVRVERMSRHIYDLAMMMDSDPKLLTVQFTTKPYIRRYLNIAESSSDLRDSTMMSYILPHYVSCPTRILQDYGKMTINSCVST